MHTENGLWRVSMAVIKYTDEGKHDELLVAAPMPKLVYLIFLLVTNGRNKNNEDC